MGKKDEAIPPSRWGRLECLHKWIADNRTQLHACILFGWPVTPNWAPGRKPVEAATRRIGLAVVAVLLTVSCSTEPSSDEGSDSTTGSSSDRPGEPPIYTGTPDQYYAKIIPCMRERGFVLTPNDPRDGPGWEADYPPDQTEAFQSALRECEFEIGVLPPPGLATPEEASEEYDRQLALRDCLVANGYPVSEPPSRDVYVADYNDPDGVHWLAYDLIINTQPRDVYLAAATVCPQYDS